MLVGHLAIGLAAKCREPRVSLGTFVGAAMLSDLLLIGFWLSGIERVDIVNRVGAAEYFRAIDIGWSHGLVTAMAWAAVAGGLAGAARYERRAALLIATVVFSHWILDAISHPADMPLVPGGTARVGFGLWRSLPLTLLVEGSLWLLALGWYATSFPARGRAGLHGFWGAAALLTLVWYNNVAGLPPPDPESAPIASGALFAMLVMWAYWVDGRRERLTSSPT
jgi:hypothetical protein